MSLDAHEWQRWLDDALRSHGVPGAALAVTAGGETAVLASGVLSRKTQVEATPASIWQIGSISKVFTATQIMQLIGEEKLGLDTKVVEILPEFRVADAEVTKRVTIRNLLTHTSGIDGDISVETGPGDDAIARYVSGLADVPQLHPLDAMLSYCNAGWVIAGRIVEVLTARTWDQALADQLIEPLGLRETVVSPEAALLQRTAVGHVPGSAAGPEPVSVWGFSRSWGPANQIIASAGDVMAFALMHLDGGRNAAGDPVLAPELAADMQRPRADMVNPTRRVDHLGLGWWLCDWGSRTVYGHDGTTFGQTCFLRVEPQTGTAVALLTNARTTSALAADLFQRAFGELEGITIPVLRPPNTPLKVDSSFAVGVYERRAQRITVSATEGGLRASVEARRSGSPPHQIDLVALSDEAWGFQVEPDGPWTAWRFAALPDGTRFVHDGLQITPMVQS
jgi:CubicO group peptidase (beta-lactamase class C family)